MNNANSENQQTIKEFVWYDVTPEQKEYIKTMKKRQYQYILYKWIGLYVLLLIAALILQIICMMHIVEGVFAFVLLALISAILYEPLYIKFIDFHNYQTCISIVRDKSVDISCRDYDCNEITYDKENITVTLYEDNKLINKKLQLSYYNSYMLNVGDKVYVLRHYSNNTYKYAIIGRLQKI